MGIGPTICQPPTPTEEITYEYNAVLCFNHSIPPPPLIYVRALLYIYGDVYSKYVYNKIKQKIRLCNITLEFGFGWVAVFELTELHQQISMSLNEFHLLNSQAKIYLFFFFVRSSTCRTYNVDCIHNMSSKVLSAITICSTNFH